MKTPCPCMSYRFVKRKHRGTKGLDIREDRRTMGRGGAGGLRGMEEARRERKAVGGFLTLPIRRIIWSSTAPMFLSVAYTIVWQRRYSVRRCVCVVFVLVHLYKHLCMCMIKYVINDV